ncbi:SRPBCC family protein [Algoriphagus yeomjeoni]|uniref:SRPBCC family protein n=1 Tax=Algoriphagus yeomjeoni TaxID=291403 RepID=UPI003CE5305D
MKINLSTQVNQDYLSVKNGFDETLFTKLSPPFPPVKLARFDGSEVGDLVSLELNFIFFKQKWTSEISESNTTESEYYFVDIGTILPFFLKKWRHKHRIIKNGNQTIIRDEIDFSAPFGLATILLYPAIYLQFLYRKPIYKKIFA